MSRPPHGQEERAAPDDLGDDLAPGPESGLGSGDELLRAVARVPSVPPPAPDPLVQPGARIDDRFVVVETIARGGMGVVVLAEDEKLKRRVAVKLLPPSFAADPDRARRFVREARAAAALAHANIVTLYEAGEHEGRAYLVMEYLRGESLGRLVSRRQLSVEEALRFARQILTGLAHAHASGLLHRDLKPENVFVTTADRVKLLDFGLVKSSESGPGQAVAITGTGLTHDEEVVGTPGYMSPEQARGLHVDARTDLFAFGVVLYEMIAGRPPFVGPTRADVTSALLRDEPLPLDAVCPEAGPELAAVVARCLAKSADARFSTALEVQSALDAATRARASVARRWLARARRPRTLVAAAGALAATLALGWALGRPTTTRATASAQSDAAPAIEMRAITAHPPPRSGDSAALAAYAQALQAIRDADWGLAKDRLNEAVDRDPGLAAAHLRLATILSAEKDGPADGRAAFARAMQGRAALSERDQQMLLALEPVINRDPAERSVTRERLAEATRLHPGDAELWHLYAMFGASGEEDSVQAERRAVAIDPQFADAWQILGAGLAASSHTEEALAAFERCIAIAPLSADCRGERAHVYSYLGECARMEEDLRRGLSSSPRAAKIWHDERASALFALGRSDEAVLEAFRRKWSLIEADRRAGVELYDRALVDVARGRFAEAEALLDDGARAVELDPNARVHERFAGLKAQILAETGRAREASKVAGAYLTKKDVWLGSFVEIDQEVSLLRLREHAGDLAPDEFAKARDGWIERARASAGRDAELAIWACAYAHDATRQSEFDLALAKLPPFDPKRLVTTPVVAAELGAVYVHVNRPAEAAPVLERATASCAALRWPIGRARSLLALGEAREAIGEREGACAAYGQVLAAWPAASRSVTRDHARVRSSALRCAARDG